MGNRNSRGTDNETAPLCVGLMRMVVHVVVHVVVHGCPISEASLRLLGEAHLHNVRCTALLMMTP
eukprot:m.37589 g.37589  ORF g.37589 m.37589 type:complete len:65 (+) comp14575_c0_seq1:160-354(+)